MFTRTGHLTDKELIRFIDGEMPGGTAHRIRQHLVTCADCHSRKEQLERAASEFADIHRAIIASRVPSASESRTMLKAKLAAARQSTPPSLRERFAMATAAHPWGCLFAGIAIAALSITAFNLQSRFFQTPSMPSQLEARLLPDSGLTPGATRPVELADICMEDGDNDLDPAVSPSIKEAVFQAYGVNDNSGGGYQVDYLINPQLGGTDDVQNLWPEPYGSKVWNARAKDALETRLHRMVCDRQIDLASAQHDIATDWIAAYKKYFRMTSPS